MNVGAKTNLVTQLIHMILLFFRREREGSMCRCGKSVEKIFPRISVISMSSPKIKSKVYLLSLFSLQLGRVAGVCGRHQLSLKCTQMGGKVDYLPF